VQYAAFMIFIVIIGGLGTIEGPIIGALVFFALQQWLSDLGTWYLVILGLVAIAVVLFVPGGLWGLLSGRGRVRLFPVGHRLISDRPRFTPTPTTSGPRPDDHPLDPDHQLDQDQKGSPHH